MANVLARVRRLLVLTLALILVAAVLPAGLDIPGLGPARAHAAAPVRATPPPAINPAPAIQTVATGGPTTVTGNITDNEVWGPQGSPYLIPATVAVTASASLTLLPGTVVKLGGGLTVAGQLLSLGTPLHHVVITSLRDDTAMGDTNGDGSSTVAARGDWTAVRVAGLGGPGSNDLIPPSVIDYTDVRYGGGANEAYCWLTGAIVVDNDGRLVLSNSTVTDSERAAVVASVLEANAYVGLYNNTFARSCIGLGLVNTRADVVGNHFDASLDSATYGNTLRGRMWFNTIEPHLTLIESDGLTRSEFDVQYNLILGSVRYTVPAQNVQDWSRNWWGSDINQALPACLDPGIAHASHPPIITHPSNACPPGQEAVNGFDLPTGAGPGLTASPSVLPVAVREAFAPRLGPVNTYTGALAYSTADLALEDAGQALTATRAYRSDLSTGSDAGPGWTLSYSEGVSSNGDVATLGLANGASLDFWTDPAVGYVPAPGVSAAYATGTGGTSITTASQDSYQFDPAGDLQAMALGDPGHQVTVSRTGGKPDRITGSSGRYVAFSRASGRVQSVSDSTGRSVALTYSGGRLAGVTGIDGQTETYAYDGSGRLTEVTTPLGRAKLAAGYDGSGRVAWVEQQGVGRTTFDYDPAQGRTTATTADGAKLVQEYDFAGRLVRETVLGASGSVGGSGRHVVYDGEGHAVAVVSGVPAVPVTGYGPYAAFTGHDKKGDPVITVDPFGRTTKTTFNSQHKPVTSTRTTGPTTTAVTTRAYDATGRLSTVTDAVGGVWSYAYNAPRATDDAHGSVGPDPDDDVRPERRSAGGHR